MTDPELLELAARAIGCNFKEGKARGYYLIELEDGWTYWNPLTDDGDALRLAVKLQMDVLIWEEYVAVSSMECAELDEDALDGCIYASTRRAIVRAAASIGKDMP